MARRPTRSRSARVRRVRRRRFERTAVGLLIAWHRWLPSWGVSVLAHAVALLVLALIYFGSSSAKSQVATFDTRIGPGPDRVDPLGEEVTTLVPADRAGDPWTKGGEAFPSFSFSSLKPDVEHSERPSQPASAKFAPTIAIPRISLPRGTQLGDRVQGLVHIEDMTAPFAGRDPDTKAKLVRREGGSVQSERAVALGLEWLARHQRADGAWTLDCHEQCPTDPPCPIDSFRPAVSDTAATGLGLLPMLGAGYIHNKPSRYSDNVKRGLDYLMSCQSPEGELFLGGGVNYRFYSHAIAAMALCEAYGLSKDEKLKIPAQRAINFIAKNQSADGGWRYFPGQPGDTSVIGWQIFALRSGKLAGLDVPKQTIAGCRAYLDLAATDPKQTLYAYRPGEVEKMTMTAEALLCRQYLGWTSDNVSLRRGAGSVYIDLSSSGERNIYYWYYATQLLHNLGGKDWLSWNKHVRDGLVGMQIVGPGCDRGSWSPIEPQPDVWGQRTGRHYVTTLSLLTLEVYYRWLPLYRPAEVAVDPKDAKAAQDRARVERRPAPEAQAKAKGR